VKNADVATDAISQVTVLVNGKARSVTAGINLAELLNALSLEAGSVATAVNGEFVAATRRQTVQLGGGDRIDCFRQITGG